MFVILGLYVDDFILVFNNTLFLNNTKKNYFKLLSFVQCGGFSSTKMSTTTMVASKTFWLNTCSMEMVKLQWNF
jgi:hypothetical protein